MGLRLECRGRSDPSKFYCFLDRPSVSFFLLVTCNPGRPSLPEASDRSLSADHTVKGAYLLSWEISAIKEGILQSRFKLQSCLVLLCIALNHTVWGQEDTAKCAAFFVSSSTVVASGSKEEEAQWLLLNDFFSECSHGGSLSLLIEPDRDRFHWDIEHSDSQIYFFDFCQNNVHKNILMVMSWAWVCGKWE